MTSEGPEPRPGPLDPADREELERLRGEVDQLHAERRHAGPRWIGAVALLVIGVLLAVTAAVAVFVRNQVLNTNRYVDTVAPLARDPAVQAAVTDRLTNEIMARVDVKDVATKAADSLKAQGAPPRVDSLVDPLVSAVRGFVHSEIGKIVRSDEFALAWTNANRTAHAELVAVLTGKSGKFLDTSDTTVSLNLGAFLNTVKGRLADRGFTLAESVPSVNVKYTLFQSSDLPRARAYTRALDRAATWLPILSLVALAGGVALAPNRRRGLLVAAVLFGGGMAVLLSALAIARQVYLDRLPASVSSDAASAVYDTVLRYLVAGVEALLALAVLIVVVTWLAGPSRLATLIRDNGARVLGAAGRGLRSAPLGPAPQVARRYRRVIELIAVVLAALLFVVLLRHGVGAPLWLALGVAVIAAAVEILARVPGPPGARPAG